MKFSVTNVLIALGLIAIGIGIAAAGIYLASTLEKLMTRRVRH